MTAWGWRNNKHGHGSGVPPAGTCRTVGRRARRVGKVKLVSGVLIGICTVQLTHISHFTSSFLHPRRPVSTLKVPCASWGYAVACIMLSVSPHQLVHECLTSQRQRQHQPHPGPDATASDAPIALAAALAFVRSSTMTMQCAEPAHRQRPAPSFLCNSGLHRLYPRPSPGPMSDVDFTGWVSAGGPGFGLVSGEWKGEDEALRQTMDDGRRQEWRRARARGWGCGVEPVVRK